MLRTVYIFFQNLSELISRISKLVIKAGGGYIDANKILLYFDLRPGQKCHSKVMHRKVTHSNGSYERKSGGRKLADEMGRAKKIPMEHS